MSGYRGEEPTEEGRAARNPEDRLEQVMADFRSHASILEAEARDLEDRMLACRARAAGLRTAVGGLEASLERYALEVAKAKEFAHERDGRNEPDTGTDSHYPDAPERGLYPSGPNRRG